MTSSSAPSPAPDNATVTVAVLEHTAQAGIREIVFASLRADCWQAFTAALDSARAAAPSRMPWTDASAVTEVSYSDGLAACMTVLDLVRRTGDRPLWETVKAAMTRAAQRSEARSAPDSSSPRKYPPQVCARPGCGVTFTPKRPAAKYCSPSCRQGHYTDRLKARQEAQQA